MLSPAFGKTNKEREKSVGEILNECVMVKEQVISRFLSCHAFCSSVLLKFSFSYHKCRLLAVDQSSMISQVGRCT